MVKVRRRTMLGMALGIALISAGSTCGQPTRNTSASMNRYKIALDEFQKRELQAAVTDSKKALDYDPDNADALNLLGLIAAQRGVDDIDLAEKRRCERGPVGQSLRKEADGYFAEAARYFKRAIKARKDHAEAYNSLAAVSIRLGRYDEAVLYAKEALAYAPRLMRVETARANLGWAYYYQRNYVKAEQELLQSTSRDPAFCVGAYRLAKVQWDQRRPGQVIEALEPVMRAGNCPILEAHQLLGMAFVSEKQDRQARSWFKSCAELEPASCVAEECKRSLALLPGGSEPDDEGDEDTAPGSTDGDANGG